MGAVVLLMCPGARFNPPQVKPQGSTGPGERCQSGRTRRVPLLLTQTERFGEVTSAGRMEKALLQPMKVVANAKRIGDEGPAMIINRRPRVMQAFFAPLER